MIRDMGLDPGFGIMLLSRIPNRYLPRWHISCGIRGKTYEMKIFPQFLIRSLWLIPVLSFAQSNTNDIKSTQQMVNVEQQQFRDFLTMAAIDPNIKKELQKFTI